MYFALGTSTIAYALCGASGAALSLFLQPFFFPIRMLGPLCRSGVRPRARRVDLTRPPRRIIPSRSRRRIPSKPLAHIQHPPPALDKTLIQLLAFERQLVHMGGDAFLCRVALFEVAVRREDAVGEVLADVLTLQTRRMSEGKSIDVSWLLR